MATAKKTATATGRASAAEAAPAREQASEASRVAQVLEALSSMTQLELLELEGAIRQRFDLSAASFALGAGSQGPESSKAAPTFSLVLESAGGLSKVEALKTLNAALGLTIAQAKEVLEKLPYTLLEGVAREEAEAKVRAIEDVKKGFSLSIR